MNMLFTSHRRVVCIVDFPPPLAGVDDERFRRTQVVTSMLMCTSGADGAVPLQSEQERHSVNETAFAPDMLSGVREAIEAFPHTKLAELVNPSRTKHGQQGIGSCRTPTVSKHFSCIRPRRTRTSGSLQELSWIRIRSGRDILVLSVG